MLRQSYNNVHILGRLNEINLKERDSAKDGRHYISGTVTFLVNQNVSGIDEQEVIPVQVFSWEKTNAGQPNPAYQNAHDLMTKGVSVAAVGVASKADSYECNCRLQESNFKGRDGTILSVPQISGSFFSKRSGPAAEEEDASFEAEVVLASVADEVKNEETTGRMLVDGLIIQYNGTPDKVRFVVESPDATSYIEQNWEAENTVKLSGKIRYGSETVEVSNTEVAAFGEAPVKVRTRNIHEFVVTAGSAPYDEEKAYDCNEVIPALAEKKRVVEERLNNAQSKNGSATGKAGSNRLSRGF